MRAQPSPTLGCAKNGASADASTAQGRTSIPLWIDERFGDLFDHNGIGCLDDLFSVAYSDVLSKPSLPSWRERLIVDLTDADGLSHRFYLKRFTRPPWRRQLGRILSGQGRRSTAGVERFWLASLSQDGIAVPRAAAFAEHRVGPWERRSAIVLAEVPGRSLERWVDGRREAAPGPMRDALARFVARFHEAGYVHRDLYASHVFLDDDAARDTRFHLIDLQRVMHKPLRRQRWRLRDLAQLNYSVPDEVAGVRDRLRWFKVYLGARSPGRKKRHAMIRWIQRKSARIADRDARRAARSPIGKDVCS